MEGYKDKRAMKERNIMAPARIGRPGFAWQMIILLSMMSAPPWVMQRTSYFSLLHFHPIAAVSTLFHCCRSISKHCLFSCRAPLHPKPPLTSYPPPLTPPLTPMPPYSPYVPPHLMHRGADLIRDVGWVVFDEVSSTIIVSVSERASTASTASTEGPGWIQKSQVNLSSVITMFIRGPGNSFASKLLLTLVNQLNPELTLALDFPGPTHVQCSSWLIGDCAT